MVITLLVATAAMVPVRSQASPDEQTIALRKHGLRAVTPPTAATDFTLATLAGGQASLSKFEGRWTVLTFFASWCGACKGSLPSLEKLWQSVRGKGVAIVGVAIESDRAKIQRFVSQLSLSFPVMIDDRSQVASIYHAQSIPISYVIDPRGQITAIARGARDWTRMTGLFDTLIDLSPPDHDGGSNYTQGQKPVELPSTLVPPTATVIAPKLPLKPNRAFLLSIDVTWAGDLVDYVLLPPEVALPEGVEHLGTSASTASGMGTATVRYDIKLQASVPGTYTLDPIRLRYTPHQEPEPVSQRISGPTIEIHPVQIAGLSPWSFFGSAGALALAIVATAWFVRRRRGASPGQSTTQAEAEYDKAKAVYDSARRARIAGDPATFLELVATLDPGLDDAGLLQGVRYGGLTPPKHELERLERRAAQAVEQLQPAPEQAAARKLKRELLVEQQPEQQERGNP